MKRFFTTLIFFLFFSISLFCEEGISVANESEGLEESSFSLPLKVGGYFDFNPVLGKLTNYFGINMGGGIAVEYNLPISVSEDLSLGFLLENLGISGRFSIGNYTRKNKTESPFTSMLNLRFQAGVFTVIPISNFGLSFVPDISLGAILNMPKLNPEYNNSLPKNIYCDMLMTISLGGRYANENLLEGKLEFELSPEYSIAFEKGNTLHYLGFRFGILYNFE